MFERPNPLSRWCISLACGALLTACGGTDPQRQMTSAKAYLDKGELRSAVIELKTVLQKQPDREEARFLLGKALLESEDPVGAALELRKALDLKHSANEVTPLLARALLEQGQAAEVIAQFSAVKLEDKAAQASVMTSVALALAQSGQAAKAEATLNQALEAFPGHGPAQVALARLAASKGDFGGALKTLEAVISSGSASPDAWSLQGDLLAQAASDRAAALAAYRKALALDAKHVAAHAGVMRLLLAANDLEAATAQMAELNKARPGHPMARFFAAQLAFEKRDYKAAREAIQQVLKAAPDHPMANHLAGAIELASGSTTVARSHLGKTLQAAPGNVAARRMLAAAILRTGDADKALEVLEPLLSGSTPDPMALALAGEAQMQAGRLDAAAEFFARSGKAQPNNPATQTALARTKFLKGDPTGAIADLERIAAADPGTSADLELINAQLRRRDASAALKAIEGLERKLAGKPLPLYLRGLAQVQLKDPQKAQAAFEKALSLDASFLPAVVSLATMELSAGKPEQAQARMEAFLKAHPGHARATLGLVDLKVRQKAPSQQVVELLNKAVQANPGEALLRVRLVEQHLRDKANDAALSAAQQADAALPNQPSILDALGRAQFAAGQQNQAMATFNKILTIQPKSVVAHLRVADANVAAKNSKAAVQALRRAIAAQPDVPVLYQQLFVLLVRDGNVSDAMQLARDVQKRQPGHSLGWILEGDALRAQKNSEPALAAYRTGSTKAAPTDAAARYHALLSSTGKQAEAEKFAANWVKDHPKDLGFALYRADAVLARRELDRAEALYRKVLEIAPDHVPALNNLAWVMVRLNKPGGLALAERANQLAPDQPALMDTLAMALAAEKRLEPALELQKKALAMRPDSDALKLGLARIYLQSGNKAQAKELLEPLAQLGSRFSEQDEVKSLLAGI